MYHFKKILVGLDLSDLDDTLMNFARYLTQSDTVEHITLVNIIRDEDLPEDIKADFPDLKEKIISERCGIIRQKVKKYLTDSHKQEINVLVKAGGIAKQMLRISDIMDIDLIAIGRREKSEGSGLLAQRLARRASCALLIVPEGTVPQRKRLLVPIDFSEYSKLALEKAIDLSRAQNGTMEVVTLNVYNVPNGYHYSGKSFEDFAKVMEENARKKYKKFIQGIDIEGVPLKDLYDLDDNDDYTTNIHDIAKKLDADGIIIGAKGRTATTAFFLGSIAEKLIQKDSEFPLLVMRPKGKNAGILDFLREEV